jgi:glycosyltransferase involved in cell wall biosynthesis
MVSPSPHASRRNATADIAAMPSETKPRQHRRRSHSEPEVAHAGPIVLQVIPELHAGGAEQTTLDVGRALVKAQFGSIVVSESGRLGQLLRAAGAEIIKLPVASKNPHTMWRNARAIAKIIRSRNIAVVHARSRSCAWSAMIAARKTGVPFVTTYHGIYNASGPFKRFYNSIMARGDTVIANSEWTANHIRTIYPEAAERITVIPRGVDLARFRPESVTAERIKQQRDWWMVKPDDRVILLPGRLSRWKGQHLFLEAIKRLKDSGQLPPNVKAVLAGDPQGRENYLDELTGMIRTHLEGIAVLSGHVIDMPAAYSAANIVVSASIEPEAFGRVPPEASAMERTIIATDHGGARETVRTGETGFLIKPNDADALAKALADLLSRPPSALQEMGRKGRAFVSERFSIERMCADTLEVYRKAMKPRAK